MVQIDDQGESIRDWTGDQCEIIWFGFDNKTGARFRGIQADDNRYIIASRSLLG